MNTNDAPVRDARLIAEWVVCGVVPTLLCAEGRSDEAEAISDFGPGKLATLVAVGLAAQQGDGAAFKKPVYKVIARLVGMAWAVVDRNGDARQLAREAGAASGMTWAAGGLA